MYLEAIDNKKHFERAADQQNFYSAFIKPAQEYAREIFLDPSLCENPCFALP